VISDDRSQFRQSRHLVERLHGHSAVPNCLRPGDMGASEIRFGFGSQRSHVCIRADKTRFRVVPHIALPKHNAWLGYNNASAQLHRARRAATRIPHIGVVAISGTPLGSNVVWAEHDPAIQATSVPPSPRQPSGGGGNQTIDDGFLSAVWQGGTLWVSGNDGCRPAGDTTTRRA